jgi:hypothetical protein
MQCPPELGGILAEIITTGLLRIRAQGSMENAERCAVEADHLHNLPELLAEYKPELLDFYWRVERVVFIRRSAREDTAAFEPLWAALAEHVRMGQSDVVEAR